MACNQTVAALSGHTVNEWLGNADDVPIIMAALVKQGLIRLGDPVKQSRFWKLLQGPGAKIFRVLSPYELPPILD